MYETENDISKNRRSELNALMNQRLADAIDLQMQMKQAHWNVKGPSFIGLHELFDQVDEAVESYVDMIAERIVQLDGIAEGTVRVAAVRSRLAEYPPSALRMSRLSLAHSPPSGRRRATLSVKRMSWMMPTRRTCSLKSREIDKWLWFVEAHSQAPK
jgi:starvation-inducible DNA-binding protein